MLPYITYTELEALESVASHPNPYFITINCQGVDFDTSTPNVPVHINGIWVILSSNKKISVFTNYKIDGQIKQASISNAYVGEDTDGYYLRYTTPYGEFFVRPNDDIYFIPRLIPLAGIVPDDAKFTQKAICREINNHQNTLFGFSYEFPIGTLPVKLSHYMRFVTVSLSGPSNIRHIPCNVTITQAANGTENIKISLQCYKAEYSAEDISVKDCYLHIN